MHTVVVHRNSRRFLWENHPLYKHKPPRRRQIFKMVNSEEETVSTLQKTPFQSQHAGSLMRVFQLKIWKYRLRSSKQPVDTNNIWERKRSKLKPAVKIQYTSLNMRLGRWLRRRLSRNRVGLCCQYRHLSELCIAGSTILPPLQASSQIVLTANMPHNVIYAWESAALTPVGDILVEPLD